MRIELSKEEVYSAITAYMLIKGFAVDSTFQQKWTNNNGIHSVIVNVDSHSSSDEDTLKYIREKM